MLNNIQTLVVLVAIIYVSTPDLDSAQRVAKQTTRSYNKCIQNKSITFMMTWGPSSKTSSLVDAFKGKNLKSVLMVNPNMVTPTNAPVVNDAFGKSQTVGMQIPLWPEELETMSALEFATQLKNFADRISVAMNFAGQWPKYVRIPNISKANCLVDISPMVQIANSMGFVVLQNTRGNGDLQSLDSISIMQNYLDTPGGYIFSIEDSDTNAIDNAAVTQILSSAEAKGYKVIQASECVGLSSESTLKSSNNIPTGLSNKPGFFTTPSKCIDPVAGTSDDYKPPNITINSASDLGMILFTLLWHFK